MNKVVITISFVLIVILFILILLADILKNKDRAINTKISPIPTQNTDLTEQIKDGYPIRDERSIQDDQISPQVDVKTLTQPQTEQFEKIATLSGYTSPDIDIEYSDFINKYYVHEKTPNAKNILHGLIGDDLYDVYKNSRNYGNIFVKTNSPKVQKDNDKRKLIKDFSHKKTLPTKTPPKIKQLPEIKIMSKLIQNIFKFSINHYPPASSSSQVDISGSGQAGMNPNNPLDAIFIEAGQKTGTPPLVLKGINAHECNLQSEPASNIIAWSQPGAGLPPSHKCYDAGRKGDGIDLGPMQLYVKYFQQELTAVNRLGGYTHTPNEENIRDAMYAAGDKLRKNSGGDWSCQKLKDVIYVWARGTERYVSPIQQDTFEWVWGYYTIGSPVENTPC